MQVGKNGDRKMQVDWRRRENHMNSLLEVLSPTLSSSCFRDLHNGTVPWG